MPVLLGNQGQPPAHPANGVRILKFTGKDEEGLAMPSEGALWMDLEIDNAARELVLSYGVTVAKESALLGGGMLARVKLGEFQRIRIADLAKIARTMFMRQETHHIVTDAVV